MKRVVRWNQSNLARCSQNARVICDGERAVFERRASNPERLQFLAEEFRPRSTPGTSHHRRSDRILGPRQIRWPGEEEGSLLGNDQDPGRLVRRVVVGGKSGEVVPIGGMGDYGRV